MPIEADKCSSTRKPLSDCTNTVAASLSAASSRRKLSLKSSVPRSSGCSSRIGDTASQKSNTSIGSNNGPIPTTNTALSSVHHQYSPSLPQHRSCSGNLGKSAPSSTQKGKRNARTGKNKGKTVSQDSMVDKSYPVTASSLDLSSSAASGISIIGTSKFKNIYTLKLAPETRRYRDNRKLIEPFSCPPGKRLKDAGNQLDDEAGDQYGIRSNTVLEPKKRARTKTKVEGSLHAMPKEEVEKLRAYYADIDTFELPVEEASDSDLD